MDKTEWKVGQEKRLPVLRKRNLGYQITGHRWATIVYVSRHFVVLDMGPYKEAFQWQQLEKWNQKHDWWY